MTRTGFFRLGKFFSEAVLCLICRSQVLVERNVYRDIHTYTCKNCGHVLTFDHKLHLSQEVKSEVESGSGD